MTDTPSPAAAGAATEREEVLAVLEPFARHADAVSLSDALGHIERAHLMAARDLVAQLRAELEDEALGTVVSLDANLDISQMRTAAAERLADRYKALAEGERERCAIALEEQFYCRHYLINALRALPAPPLPEEPQPTNKRRIARKLG